VTPSVVPAAPGPVRAAGVPARALTLALALALAASAGCGGCHRDIRFAPGEADSTHVGADSLRVLLRNTQDLWESDGGEEAAKLSALVLRVDLQAHAGEPWGGRARRLLDSLDIGAELASDDRVLAANFFSRSRPDAGAWPWLFWHARGGIAARALAGRNLQLLHVASRVDGDDPSAWSQVAVLFGRRGAVGQEPVLTLWGRPGGDSWAPLQTLGPDSLGGAGTVSIEGNGDTSTVLVARTFRGMPRFEECATCPHVYELHRFRWGPAGFVRIEDVAVPSPYSAFVRFILALGNGDPDAAGRLVSDPAALEQAKLFDFGALPKGLWRAAPASDENAGSMVFFRGQQEAYQVTFEPRGSEWLILSIKPTTRSIE